jgi:hypothetical protein
MSAEVGSGKNIDAKREEFRKYLEKEGVLEYLTKQLVKLYEETDKPSSALDYLKNSCSGKDGEDSKLKIELLEKENQQLKEKNKALENERDTLQLKVKELELPALLKEEDVVTENSPQTEVLTSEDLGVIELGLAGSLEKDVLTSEKKDSEELEEDIVTENPSKEDAITNEKKDSEELEEDVATENPPNRDALTSEKMDSEELEEDGVTENPSQEDALTNEKMDSEELEEPSKEA